MTSLPRQITHFNEFAELGDAFLIDQFGTLHDGSTPYPGAINTLLALRNMGKKIILLSNSGRRAATAEKRLVSMGFTSNCFDASLCSGEVAWQALRLAPPAYLQKNCRVLLFARSQELDILEGFDVTLVDNAKDADLVMIAGSETERYGYDKLWQRMAPAVQRGVPAICTNPDQTMIVDGRLYPGAGALARAYQVAGGSVKWFGKPYHDVYEAAFALLPGIAQQQIIGVGDSLDHDIAGAANAGCAGVLVRTGIKAALKEDELAAEISKSPHPPLGIIQCFGFL